MSDPSPDPDPSPEAVPRLLTRLNRRGFRLVMLLDGLAVFLLAVLSMVWRYGVPPWPTYTLPAYPRLLRRLGADLPRRLLLRRAVRA